jgi:hypothetical protein
MSEIGKNDENNTEPYCLPGEEDDLSSGAIGRT